MDPFPIAKIVGVGHANGVCIVGKQTDKLAHRDVGGGRYDRLALQKLDFGDRAEPIGIGDPHVKSNRGLRFGRRDLNSGRGLRKCTEIIRDALGCAVVLIFGNQRIGIVGEQLCHVCGIKRKLTQHLTVLVKRERGECFARIVLLPHDRKGHAALRCGDVTEHHNFSRAEIGLIKRVATKSATVEAIIASNDLIAVGGVGFQAVKRHVSRYRFDPFGCNDCIILVVENHLHVATALWDQLQLVANGQRHAKLVKSNRFRMLGKCRNLFGIINTDQNGLVTLHTHVLDLGAIDIFDRIERIGENSHRVTHVDLENQIFEIGAFFKHIGSILLSIEREGLDLKRVGVAQVNGDVDSRVRLCIVDLASRAVDVKRGSVGCFLRFGCERIGVQFVRFAHVEKKRCGAWIERKRKSNVPLGKRRGAAVSGGNRHTLVDRHLPLIGKDPEESANHDQKTSGKRNDRHDLFFGFRQRLCKQLDALLGVSFHNALVDLRQHVQSEIEPLTHIGSPPSPILPSDPRGSWKDGGGSYSHSRPAYLRSTQRYPHSNTDR